MTRVPAATCALPHWVLYGRLTHQPDKDCTYKAVKPYPLISSKIHWRQDDCGMGSENRAIPRNWRTIRDSPHQRVQSRRRGLEWIRFLRIFSRAAREGTCPTGIEYCRRRFCGGLQNAILAFWPPWYQTEPPHAPSRVAQAPWPGHGRRAEHTRNTDLPAGWSLITTPKRTVLKRNCTELDRAAGKSE